MIGEKLTGQSGFIATILDEIGRGGFGVVYLAQDEAGLKYAVKVIDGVSDQRIRASFMQELESAKGLEHPNVIKVIDFGEHSWRGKTSLFTVIEYCSEGDYRATLEKNHELKREPDVILGEMRQILEGLESLHQRIIHRDLKPENILVAGDTLKITDFGLAKFVDQATRTLTFKGAGTPRYMAPEVWNLGNISPATDLYAVGVMLFEAFAGEPPFTADTVNDLREKHLYEAAPRIKSRNPEVPDRVDGVVRKLLEKEPNRRYQTAKEVLDALSREAKSKDRELLDLATRMRQRHDAEESARLVREQDANHEAESQAKNRYMEHELLALIDEVIGSVNEHLEETKITRSGNPLAPTYHLGTRELCIKFFRPGELYENPKVPGRMDALRKRYVVHGGYIEIRDAGEDREGWNVFLVRPPDSIYGEWRIVETDIAALVGRAARYKPFATEAQLFADNLACHLGGIMHVYNLSDRKVERADIIKVLNVFVPAV
jgi:serine/threonine protein kinase